MGILEYFFNDRGSANRGRTVSQKEAAEGYFKEMFFLNEYFYGIPLTRIQVLDFYKNYTYTTFLAKLKAFL